MKTHKHSCSDNCRHPIQCIIPDYITKHLAQCDDAEIRRLALDTLGLSSEIRAVRNTIARMPLMSAFASITKKKERRVYKMRNREFPLPGKIARKEGDPPTKDEAVNEAYDYSGIVYDFYDEIFQRNSLDNNGMILVSSVHLGRKYNNAFWNGQQMAYGDGDGVIFTRFTKALDVVGHELTHGVVTFTSDLIYQNESGALNEHFADVMGSLVKQWYLKQTSAEADWLIGADIMGPKVSAKSLRTFKGEKAFEDDPFLGTDQQPKHINDKYTGFEDSGGVHINSGIPNHAFYQIALEIGGFAWEKAGAIWYQTLLNLNQRSDFQEAARMTYLVAGSKFGVGSLEQKAVATGWSKVGISV